MVMAPSVNLKKARRPLPAANAHRHHRQPRIAMASLQQGVTGNTGAGHSIGITHGYRPAVHVDPQISLMFPPDRDLGSGKMETVKSNRPVQTRDPEPGKDLPPAVVNQSRGRVVVAVSGECATSKTITLGAAVRIGDMDYMAGDVVAVSKALIGPVVNEGFIAQAQKLIDMSAVLSDDRKIIAEFWEDGRTTAFPPGTMMTFAQYVSMSLPATNIRSIRTL